MSDDQLQAIQVAAYETMVSASMYLAMGKNGQSLNCVALDILRTRRQDISIENNISSVIISEAYKSAVSKYQHLLN